MDDSPQATPLSRESDLQAQLADLRKRMAAAAARADTAAAEAASLRGKAPLIPIEQYIDGRIVETAFGAHFEHERLWEARRRHGTVDIGSMAELPSDWLQAISAGDVPPSDVTKWAFLDTETTGLAGGSGTCAFLIGVGRITAEGFRLKQYFMRDFEDEASQLAALAADLEDAETLVTYNGKAFDVPLLESRYRMKRARPPFTWLGHLDLLFGARRLWRLRLERCKLTHLESEVLGFERDGDIPGDMIPRMYFDYLRLRSPERLQPIFEHNALDIVTLAALTAVVPQAFHDPVAQAMQGARHGAEMVSLGRWLWRTERSDEALALFRQAVRENLRDDLLFRTLWDMAQIERRAARFEAAVTIWTELAGCRNEHRVEACIELAKHYERREKDYGRALEYCELALSYEDAPDHHKRRERLVKRARTPQNASLL